jgi:uncharacterized protein (TIGR02145 family)
MKNVYNLPATAFITAFILLFPGCKKTANLPTLITSPVSDVTPTTAVSGGSVTSSGGSDVTEKGVCWGVTHNPVIAYSKTIDGAGPGAFSSLITGLIPNDTYYVRAYATNSEGTAYGNEIAFTANHVRLATLSTLAVSNVTLASAVSGGQITDNGGEDVTAVGLCWGTTSNPTTSNSKTVESGSPDFISYMSGLQPSTDYYVRAYATNSAGTAYGNEVSFTTSVISEIIFNPDLTYGTVSDADGNIYRTIMIGTQLWMAENLKTTKYSDGTSLPEVADNTAWGNLITGGYSWYNNDVSTFKVIYGALYNWYAVTDNRNLCPSGWHVPSSEDWNILASFIGLTNSDRKIKETGITHWIYAYAGGTNESGFTALPAGQRDPSLSFQFVNIGYQGAWWSTTSGDNAGVFADFYASGSIDDIVYPALAEGLETRRISGMSVRCVKDN